MSNPLLDITPIPLLSDVIMKVKLLEDLDPLEELVYLVYIEELSVEQAKKIVEEEYKDYETNNPEQTWKS